MRGNPRRLSARRLLRRLRPSRRPPALHRATRANVRCGCCPCSPQGMFPERPTRAAFMSAPTPLPAWSRPATGQARKRPNYRADPTLHRRIALFTRTAQMRTALAPVRDKWKWPLQRDLVQPSRPRPPLPLRRPRHPRPHRHRTKRCQNLRYQARVLPRTCPICPLQPHPRPPTISPLLIFRYWPIHPPN
jgi:hypothetical protein